MTLVTTSRKAAPDLRALARGLAFAVGGRYLARGKTGLRELVTLDTKLFLFSIEPDGLQLRWFVDGEPAGSYRVTAHEGHHREGPIVRGLLASDAVRSALGPRFETAPLDDDGWDLGFDGHQRLRYRLRLAPAGGADDADDA
jgi:U3 small nucleolar ribonucleoprotein protein IMP4